MQIAKRFRFESAHRLPNVGPGHKCARLHGHSFEVEVVLEGEVDATTGMVADFADISAAWAPLHEVLDHRYLNDISGLENPTSENLAVWIWRRLSGNLPLLAKVVVHETCTSRCELGRPKIDLRS